MADIKKPSTVTYNGEVTSISKAIESKTKAGSFYRILTLDGWDGKPLVTRAISDKMYENSKDILQKGAFVSITCEVRVEGVTEYTDSITNDVVKHTSSGEAISKVTGASKEKMVMQYQATLRA